MQLKRVVITGMGSVSPFGNDVKALMDGIDHGRSAVRLMEGWDKYTGLRSHVAAPAEIQNERKIPRNKRRFMGRMSIFSAQAAEQALADSGFSFSDIPQLKIGCVIGSTMGSAKSINDAFEIMLPEKDISQLNSSMFFQCMSHTAAANVAQYLELEGFIMATSAACASSLHAIGVGYDLVRLGRQEIMLCGGAEEVHPTVTGSFDVLMATSAGFNNNPSKTPRPFDRDRDGLVCGEGSGVLVLEDYDSAVWRNTKIYAEIIGYSTNGNGSHVSQSNKDSMVLCMQQALSDAGITKDDIDYINAHATATIQGDKEEAEAIKEVFGSSVPVSSLKGYIGHTLGASGAIELIASLQMMQKGVIYPTLNLDNVSPECMGINHVTSPVTKKIDTILKNCFAFGGINAALVCRKL
ncbi:MAG: beta-ketoacyl-[acyl-carrier-protein] synthase family protein [Nitrospirae bacterium]|nr:beta-ketoacyl-[acyl-carrier-protein] synthase family protein [Nitrospirota bacterium]MBI3377232.1 beta-ketoacyl-[acyl-carrier-protein] synthase family protein [Nitrospirota bacterium]